MFLYNKSKLLFQGLAAFGFRRLIKRPLFLIFLEGHLFLYFMEEDQKICPVDNGLGCWRLAWLMLGPRLGANAKARYHRIKKPEEMILRLLVEVYALSSH